MLVAYALKSTVILATAWLLTAILRRHSAAARHMVWTGGMASVVVLPLLSLSLPAWYPPLEPTGLVFQATGRTAPEVFSKPAVATSVPVAAAQIELPLTGIWAAGTALMLLSIVVSYIGMARRRKTAVPFDGLSSSARLLRAGAGSMPMAFGVFNPVVFLPEDAAEWSAECLSLVLQHELAHVRRADVLTQLIARVALAMHWWNPLAWKAWHDFVKERERAADDLVITAGARGSDYAGHLLEIARMMLRLPAPASTAVAMARPHQFEDRLAAILDSEIRRTAPARSWVFGALLFAVPLAAFQAVQPEVETLIRAATSQGNRVILEDAADAALAGRNFDAAKKLLDASLALSKNPVDQGLSLYRLGVLESRRDHKQEAASYFTRALEVLGSRPQAARVLIKLGVAAINEKEFSHAFGLFEKTMAIDPSSSGQALFWMGVVRRSENNPAQAELHFRDAFAREDPKWSDAAVIGQVYGQFLLAQGRNQEAADINARVAMIRTETRLTIKPTAPNVLKVGGGVTSPKLLEKVEPVYSEEARAAKLTGATILSVEVHPDGRAHNMRVVRPLGLGLDDRAIEAVSNWRFQPATQNGQPVTVIANIEVNWRLL